MVLPVRGLTNKCVNALSLFRPSPSLASPSLDPPPLASPPLVPFFFFHFIPIF